MDRYTTEKEIAGINYRVRELTLDEIRAWLKQMEQAYGAAPTGRNTWLRRLLVRFGLVEKPLPSALRDVADVMLFDGFVMLDLRVLTDLTAEQIGGLTPRQVRSVWGECEKVNEDFFGFRRRLELVGLASPAMSAGILSASYQS